MPGVDHVLLSSNGDGDEDDGDDVDNDEDDRDDVDDDEDD